MAARREKSEKSPRPVLARPSSKGTSGTRTGVPILLTASIGTGTLALPTGTLAGGSPTGNVERSPSGGVLSVVGRGVSNSQAWSPGVPSPAQQQHSFSFPPVPAGNSAVSTKQERQIPPRAGLLCRQTLLQSLTTEQYLHVFQIPRLFDTLVEQLAAQKPVDPLAFLRHYLDTQVDGIETPTSGGGGATSPLPGPVGFPNLDVLRDAALGHEACELEPDQEALIAELEAPEQLSLIHQIIARIGDACRALGYSPQTDAVERWGLIVYEAMAGPRRFFHSPRHALDVGGDDTHPIEQLAGAFHDIIYVQVDKGFPARIAAALSPLVSELPAEPPASASQPPPPVKFRLNEVTEERELTRIVLGIFGRRAGDELTPFSGLNELLSALAAALELGTLLAPKHIAQVAVCIEGTIPFRPGNPFESLYQRLGEVNRTFRLGLSEEEVEETVKIAVQDPYLVSSICEAASRVVFTRETQLRDLGLLYRGRVCNP